jgi:hypothetical protein
MPTSPGNIDHAETSEYSVARLNRDNLKDLARLHAEVYAAKKPGNYFLRKYDTAYTGVENVGFLAYNKNDEPVAYYGVLPCFIQFGNKTILAAQSADTMTHPMHRYKGMFAQLSGRTFNLCRELGILLIFGFPNQEFYKAAVGKWGWKETETMACFTIPARSVSLNFIQNGFLKKLYKQYSLFILKRWLLSMNGVANSVLPGGYAGVYRGDEYLNYKTYNDSHVISVGDAKIWISFRQGLVIGDMEDINETNFKTVISKLKGIARKLGLRRIQFHSSPGTNLYQLFAANYKPKPFFHVIFQDLGSPVPLEKIKFTFADIDIF